MGRSSAVIVPDALRGLGGPPRYLFLAELSFVDIVVEHKSIVIRLDVVTMRSRYVSAYRSVSRDETFIVSLFWQPST